ncbi:MAG: hypothetical protein ACERKD_19995 [Prolixibacteraceae bacterium]
MNTFDEVNVRMEVQTLKNSKGHLLSIYLMVTVVTFLIIFGLLIFCL